MSDPKTEGQAGQHKHLGALEFAFLTELRRRNVFRVAGAYLGSCWFLVHMGTVLGENFAPLHHMMPKAIGLLGAGLPLVLIGAWMFELTPEGFRLTRSVERRKSIRPMTARKLDYIMVVVFTLAALTMLADRFLMRRPADESAIPVFAFVILVMVADRLVGLKGTAASAATTAPADDGSAAAPASTTPVAPMAAPASMPSIAVLPFVDMSEQRNQEYFSDGLSEELIGVLSRVSALRVPARTSCFYFKGRQVTVAEIGQSLNVNHVLEGSVRKAGERVRITARLVRTDNGFQVWTESYDRTLDDIFRVQEEIAEAVVRALQVKLLYSEPSPRKGAQNPAAYELYLLGRYHWNRRSADGLHKAIDYFRQAIAADAAYALAYTGMADAYALLPVYDASEKGAETMPLARQAITRALALDEGLAEAHASLGLMQTNYEFNWPAAEQHYVRAIELKPAAPTPHHWYGLLLVNDGRFEEGLAQLRQALQLDPLSLVVNFAYGIALNSARRFEEAIAQLRKTLSLDAQFADASYFLFEACANVGHHAEAVEVYARQKRNDGIPAAEVERLEQAYARGSWQGFLRQQLAFLEAQANPVPEEVVACAARLGNLDCAFRWLERACEQRSARLTHLKTDARYDNLRPDPRFTAALVRIGLSAPRTAP